MTYSDEKIKQLALEYSILKDNVIEIRNRINLLNQIIQEIESTLLFIRKMEEMKENEELLFNIGASVYAKARLINLDKLILNVGANTLIERDRKYVISYLESRRNEIQKEIINLTNLLGGALNRMREIEEILSKEEVGK